MLIEDIGIFGGLGTDPNSMIPFILLAASGYLALTPGAAPAEEASLAVTTAEPASPAVTTAEPASPAVTTAEPASPAVTTAEPVGPAAVGWRRPADRATAEGPSAPGAGRLASAGGVTAG